jgi:membrane protease YdiL (CAAX protease family)
MSGGMAFVYILLFNAVQVIVMMVYLFGSIGYRVAMAVVAADGNPDVILDNLLPLMESLAGGLFQQIGWILGVSSLLTVLILWAITAARRQSFRRLAVLYTPSQPLRTIAVAIAAGVGFALTFDVLISFVPIPDFISQLLSDSDSSALFSTLAMAIVGSTLVPLTEELLFRGLIFSALRERFALPAAIALQALIFGLAHGNVAQGIFAAVMGVMAAFLLLRSGSVWPGVVLHAALNATSFVFEAAAPTDSPLVLALLLLVGVGIFAAAIVLWLRGGPLLPWTSGIEPLAECR